MFRDIVAVGVLSIALSTSACSGPPSDIEPMRLDTSKSATVVGDEIRQEIDGATWTFFPYLNQDGSLCINYVGSGSAGGRCFVGDPPIELTLVDGYEAGQPSIVIGLGSGEVAAVRVPGWTPADIRPVQGFEDHVIFIAEMTQVDESRYVNEAAAFDVRGAHMPRQTTR